MAKKLSIVSLLIGLIFVYADAKADDTSILQRLIDATPSGASLVIPPGTYKSSSQLSITKSISIDAHGVILNCPAGFNSGQVINITGSNTYKGLVTGLVTQGASTISFTTTGVSVGDWIWLVSDHANDLLAYSGGGVHNAEFLQVKTVSAGNVTTVDRTRLPFSANAEAFKQNFIEVKIRGLEIVMDQSYQAWGINLSDTINFLAEDVKISNAGTGGIACTRCVNPEIRRTIIKNNGTISNNRYGVLFQDSENMLIDHSVIDCNNWHAIAVGGSYASFNLTVRDSRLRNGATTAAVDFHANCRYANIINNTIMGYAGINARGPDFLIEGNTIIADYTAIIGIADDIRWMIGKVLNNRIFVTKNGVASAYVIDSDNVLIEKFDQTWEGNTIVSNDGGVLVWPSKSYQEYDNFAFRRNRLELPNTSGKYRIRWPINHNNMKFRSVDISDNEFIGGDEIQTNAYLDSFKMNGNKFRNTDFPALNQSGSAGEVEILNNRIDIAGTSVDALKLFSSNPSQTRMQVRGNRINTTGIPILVYNNSTAVNGDISDNQWLSGGGSSYCIVIDDTGQATIAELDISIRGNRCREGRGIRVVSTKTPVTYSGAIKVNDNWVHSASATHGIVISTASGNAGKGIQINGNNIDTILQVTTGINDVSVQGNLLSNGADTYNLQISGYSGDLVSRAVINNNSVKHAAGTGIYLNYIASIVAMGNIIDGFTPGGTGISINNYTKAYLSSMINTETTVIANDASGTLSTWP